MSTCGACRQGVQKADSGSSLSGVLAWISTIRSKSSLFEMQQMFSALGWRNPLSFERCD